MAEQEFQEDQLPLGMVGQRLRHAREAAGLALDDITDRTKIAKRHLVAIEENRFADLAGRTYAVGFARAYARAVGLSENVIADAVRDQLAAEEELWPAPKPDSFEPGDPARVPPAGLALAAGIGGLAVIVLLFIFWRSFISPAGTLPDVIQKAPPRAAVTAKAEGATKAPPAPAMGPVVFTALEPGIWVRFYDASGNRLFERQMALGESYTVPADADGPMVKTARPDALQVTVGGRIVPGLGDAPVTVRDVPVSAAALLARAKPQAEGEASAPAAARLGVTGAPVRPAVSASPAARRTQPALPSPSPVSSQAHSTVSVPATPAPGPSPTRPVRTSSPAASSVSATPSAVPSSQPSAETSTVSE